ncbi:hypothetical protein CCACVL1_05506 [Corchorus capsularis]|uniref:F-box domain-containing protein n=1 Tax=Corchorus capsularis TaxID=210143 RepID=A0A1R3JK09_COCAP|nr:hypothetical protein CCACVL1_05506 [Corchorus capsularis]
MATVVVLPQDIIEDILSRLPVKSLLRLRCMSKSCNFSISKDQSFARMQLKRALRSPKSSSQKILLSSFFSPYLRSLDYEKENCFGEERAISKRVFPADKTTPKVVGSCHGLLCLAFRGCEDIYLWNPTTRDYNKLPDHPHLLPNKYPTADHRSYTYSFVYGFGYDSFSDDYKVLLGCNTSTTKQRLLEVKFAIFSMREKCWRIIQQLPPIELFHRACPSGSKFVNGTLNWLVMELEKRKFGGIVAFGLKTERFLELPLPDIDTDTLYFLSGLAVLKGRLCLSIATSQSSSYLVELWVMNEYGVRQSWTRLLDSPFETDFPYHLPLCISMDNQIILFNREENRLTMLDAAGGKIPESTCQLRNCRIHSYPLSHSPYARFIYTNYKCGAHIYLESLVSPNFTNKQKLDEYIMYLLVLISPMPDIDHHITHAGLGLLEGRLCLSVATQGSSSNFMIELWDQSFARMHLSRALRSPKSSSQKILLSSTSLLPSPSPSPPYMRSLDYENNKCFGDEGAISKLVFPADVQTPLRVVGSCHGLLCLAFNKGKDIYLWNPSTRDYNKLPDHPCLLPDHDIPPKDHGKTSYSFIFGFGYDSFSDDYKVLLGDQDEHFFEIDQDEHFESAKEVKFAMFSMRENCWRIIQQLPPSKFLKQYYIQFESKFVNGTLNWLVNEFGKGALVAFDLWTERFLELPCSLCWIGGS